MLLLEQVMVISGSVAQTAVAGSAAVAYPKGEQDWGILLQVEGLEVNLVVVVVILVVISLHEREGSGELAHVDGRHGTEIERSLRSRSGYMELYIAC
jgi:hypothetical protein